MVKLTHIQKILQKNQGLGQTRKQENIMRSHVLEVVKEVEGLHPQNIEGGQDLMEIIAGGYFLQKNIGDDPDPDLTQDTGTGSTDPDPDPNHSIEAG